MLTCPWCGRRNSSEFIYAGNVASRPDPAHVTPREWRDYLYLRDNTRGWVTERWYHRAGCWQFFVVERDTATDETRGPRSVAVVFNETETRTAESASDREAT
jgi:sarcosine oxidase subunit delta